MQNDPSEFLKRLLHNNVERSEDVLANLTSEEVAEKELLNVKLDKAKRDLDYLVAENDHWFAKVQHKYNIDQEGSCGAEYHDGKMYKLVPIN